MKEEKNTQMGLRVAVLLLSVLLLPMVTAQGPPVDEEDSSCLAYAYTESERHYFLLGHNSSMFGSRLNVVHNCPNVSIYVDGFFAAQSSSNFSLPIEEGLHDFTIEADGFNVTFQNVFFFPDRLEWEYQFEEIQNAKPQFIDVELSQLRTNWAVGVGIIIVWVLTTYVYWSLISSYVDRNFIEEVTQ